LRIARVARDVDRQRLRPDEARVEGGRHEEQSEVEQREVEEPSGARRIGVACEGERQENEDGVEEQRGCEVDVANRMPEEWQQRRRGQNE